MDEERIKDRSNRGHSISHQSNGVAKPFRILNCYEVGSPLGGSVADASPWRGGTTAVSGHGGGSHRDSIPLWRLPPPLERMPPHAVVQTFFWVSRLQLVQDGSVFLVPSPTWSRSPLYLLDLAMAKQLGWRRGGGQSVAII